MRVFLFLVLAALLPALSPAEGAAQPALPEPSGPLPVATDTFGLTDRARPDPAGESRRFLRVQAWYPAAVATAGVGAPYLTSTALADTMEAEGYARLERAEIAPLRAVRTHAAWGRTPRPGPWPVLVLSHGLGMSHAHYTALAADLASHGYVVLAADHPYGGFALGPDGRLRSTGGDPADLGQDSVLARRAVEWAADASFLLDELGRTGSLLAVRLGGVADLDHVGMLGHSFGGAAALEACRLDARLLACADLDGLPFGPVRTEGVGRPALVLLSQPVYSDAELAARGRTRAEWEAMGRDRLADLSHLLGLGAEAEEAVVEVRGTGHHSFSDAPFVTPSLVTRWGGEPIDPLRGHHLTTTLLRSFFDAWLRDGSPDAVRAVAESAPEATFHSIAAGSTGAP